MKKIKGEVFKITREKKSNIERSDEEINEKYKRGEVRIVTEQARYPIKSIPGMVKSDDYKLNPEYQRRKRWDNGKKSRLIESFIMNVPLPPIFLYEYDYSKYEVMDGLQRLTSISDFYNDLFALESLEYWKELEGKRYSELPQEIQKGIDRRYLSSIVLLEETAKTDKEAQELKQIVFERLNSGGAKLTAQETRNALYNGRFNELCLRLSENKSFKKMWNIPTKDDKKNNILDNEIYKKMEDVEFVLRFFAYRYIDKLSGTIKLFLDEYLKQANNFSDETISQLETLFVDTVETTYKIFGDKAFFLPKYKQKVNKPKKTIYDPLMQSMAKNIESKDILLKNSKSILENKYKENIYFTNDNEEEVKIFNGRDNKPSVIKDRIKYFDRLFKTFIN